MTDASRPAATGTVKDIFYDEWLRDATQWRYNNKWTKQKDFFLICNYTGYYDICY